MPVYLNHTHEATHGSTLLNAADVGLLLCKVYVYWGFCITVCLVLCCINIEIYFVFVYIEYYQSMCICALYGAALNLMSLCEMTIKAFYSILFYSILCKFVYMCFSGIKKYV